MLLGISALTGVGAVVIESNKDVGRESALQLEHKS